MKAEISKSSLLKLPITTYLLDSVNKEVQILHDNQRKIERESKVLKEEASKLIKQTTKWVALYDGINQTLKEVGDIVNWAEIIEKDMQKVASAITKIVENS